MNKLLKDKRVKDFSEILLSKVLVLLLSFLVGFVIPGVLTIEGYGYYSLFTLYISYIGIFHFGLVDGLYLKYGKYDLNELPKEEFRFFIRFLLAKEILISILLLVIVNTFIIKDSNTIFVMSFAIINITAINIQSLFRNISQGTRNVRYSTFTSVFQKIIVSVFAIIALFVPADLYYIVYMVTLSHLVVFIMGIINYKDLIFGKSSKGYKHELLDLYKLGIPLLIANYIAVFITTLDKLFISSSAIYSMETLSYYSFSLTMLVIVNVIVDSIYQILYPNISRLSGDNKRKIYPLLSNVLVIITTLGISGYFFLEFLIPIILPKYTESLDILFVLLPTLIFKVDASVTKKTYIYVDKKRKANLVINVIVLLLGCMLNLYVVKNDMDVIYIAYSTLISFFIWSILFDIYFVKIGYSPNLLKYVYVAVNLLFFVTINKIEMHSLVKLFAFVFASGISTLIIHNKIIRELLKYRK